MDTMIQTNAERIKTFSAIEAKRQSKEQKTFVLSLIRFYFKHLTLIKEDFAISFATKLFKTTRRSKLKKAEIDFLDSAQKFDIPYKNENLKGYSWGTNGPAILLIHGWDSKAAHFKDFVPYLLAAGYKVVSFDGPAHGNSPGKQTDMIDFGDAVEALMRKTKDFKGIIAHSFGATSVVHKLSHINDFPIEKLIAISCSFDPPGVLTRFGSFLCMRQPLISKLIQDFEKKYPEASKTFKIKSYIRTVRAKDILLIHDKNDRVIPFNDTYELVEEWGNANFLLTENLGHKQIIKDPTVINHVINFIQK
ncbi:MAG: alpha/beta hydrolase [Sporocytophaga sp.]|uniref:alpha/beta hydrolase family protein n=1 Tax=Sporocytophaga sp. TaxID=2231183 RepID=UPI001B1981DD|nr:alpha/beta hydrolase [Sporocytophaga sp.]MBO9698925.1 alpha/beta hydrolase [Sporocytophaga sp.]